jgi:hypothetical protein
MQVMIGALATRDLVVWEPLTVVRRSVTPPQNGRVTVTLTLSAPPTHEWVQAFENSPWQRRGSVRFMQGDLPRVKSDTIEWEVPETDLIAALTTIKGALTHLDEVFPQILEGIERARADYRARAAVAQEHYEELQRQVDNFDF